jgi:CTP:molybdopterin cytidylyltransferase MocA
MTHQDSAAKVAHAGTRVSTPVAPVDAVVLAGGINRIELFPGDKPGRKALVPIGGRPFIAYVLDALHRARSVDRVIVVGARAVLDCALKWPKAEGVPDGHTLVRNAWRGLHWARTDRVLFCNPDQPLLRAEMIDYFVERALAVDADLVSSWVRRESLGPYPEGEHKFADFRDGSYAHGNLFLVRREFPDLQEVRRRMDRLYRARKSNIRFAWELGPLLFARFAIAMLSHQFPTLDETLEIAGDRFGLTIGAVVCPYPEIVLDIDEPEDYAGAERALKALSVEDAASEARAGL